MWDEIAAEVGKDFEDVKVDKMLVDAMTVSHDLAIQSIDIRSLTKYHRYEW